MQKTKFNILAIFLLFISISFLQGCKDDTVTNAPGGPDVSGLIKLNTVSAIGARANVTLYLEDSLHTGYNKVYAVLYDSLTNVLIEDAHVIPMLTDHATAGPVEEAPKTAVNGKFPFALVFLSPQALDNVMHWNIKIGVHNHGATGEPYGVATFGGLHIKDNVGKYQEKSLPGGTTLYLSYINPKTPTAGLNNFEFLINSSSDTVNFATETSYSIAVKPVLLSNGTVSSSNVNPTPSGDLGHYFGRVNLPTAGTWRINMYMTKTGYSDSTYFDVGF
ncbi:MAG: hypothetical protein JST55_07340 [Bacteroidetes bacterium]|nr:hypothetical protein [Bacteroidota bacterium]